MPLSINVGLSRKRSENYQSDGVSINVTAELDQSLLAHPDELQRQVADLYAQAEQALDRQSVRPGGDAPYPHTSTPAANPGGGYPGRDARGPSARPGYRTDGGYNGNGRGRGGGGPATDSQRRAINAIAARLGVDPHLEARDIVGADLGDLTIRQASDLIDHLKSIEPAGGGGDRNGRNGSRR